MKKTLYDRYPKTADKGIKGERWLFEKLESCNQYITVKDFTDVYFMQKNGIDGSVYKTSWYRPYYFDCKHNLIKEKDGSFLLYLEWAKKRSRPGWFRTSKADRIYHVSVNDNISIFYDLKEFRKLIRKEITKGTLKPRYKKRSPREQFLLISSKDARFKELFRFQF